MRPDRPSPNRLYAEDTRPHTSTSVVGIVLIAAAFLGLAIVWSGREARESSPAPLSELGAFSQIR